ncbi:MAG: phosphatidate cytidylyltransferase [Chloroflexia bacterium]
MLRVRFLSALVLIPLVLVAVGLGGVWLALLVALAVGLALTELFQLFAAAGYRPVRWAGFTSALFLFLAVFLAHDTTGLPFCLSPGVATPGFLFPYDRLLGSALAGTVLLTLTAQLLRRDRGGALTDWALTLAGPLYVTWPLLHFLLLRRLAQPEISPPFWRALRGPALGAGAWWILYTLVLVWMCDTAAYFVGIRWGRHRMSPYVSPKKSWEGAAAGLLTSIALAVGLVPVLGLPLPYGLAALLGALVGTVGQVGDLAESLLKRQAGVKDSGRLIPGHGGMLDRVDSLLFVAPAVYYFLQWTLR